MAASELQPACNAHPSQTRPITDNSDPATTSDTCTPTITAAAQHAATTEESLSNARNIPPRTRFQLPFPDRLEQLFKPFDDCLIPFFQRRTAGVVHFCAMAFTSLTAIETLLFLPPWLLALGYDQAGGLAASVLLTLGIVSQVPKKFVFRPRPWMVGRALTIRKDKTSSFPSRAVVCAVVFSWIVAQSLKLEGVISKDLPNGKLWLGIAVMASFAAIARINVGAHYPSDTVLGFILGCVIIQMGVAIEQIWQGKGCVIGVEYTNEIGDGVELLERRWSLRNLSLVTFVAYGITLVSIEGFWVKCNYVYGLLMSTMAFRAGFLCADSAGGGKIASVRRVVEHGSLGGHLRAASLFVSLLVFGMMTRGLKGSGRIVTFTIIYFATLAGLIFWRL